ncbi:TetR family transcriptional regulator [Novosphingobium panipatense]
MAGATRRVGAETSATRAVIIEATNQLIRDEGYASVSTRRVAARAG